MNDLERMNRQAVRLANEVASEGDALVAGNICNTWAYDPNNAAETAKIVRAMYEEQLGWAVEEGIDFVISETFCSNLPNTVQNRRNAVGGGQPPRST